MRRSANGEGKPKCLSKPRAAKLRAKGGKSQRPQYAKNVGMIQIQTGVVKLKTLAIQKESKMKIQDIEEAFPIRFTPIDRERYDDMPGMEGP